MINIKKRPISSAPELKARSSGSIELGTDIETEERCIGPVMNFTALQELLREVCDAHDKSSRVHPDHILRHFSAVGARCWPDGTIDEADGKNICDIFQTLLLSGFVIAPDFVLEIVNLKDGRDFFKETHPTDVLFFCSLNDYGPRASGNTPLQLTEHRVSLTRQRQSLAGSFSELDKYYYKISPHAMDPDAWRTIIDTRRVKLTFNYSDRDLYTERLYGRSHILLCLKRTFVPNSKDFLDITADPDFVREVMPSLNRGSPLKRIINQKLQARASLFSKKYET